MKIFINGFGRIGRTILRQVLAVSSRGEIEVVGINDIASLDTCAYLFQYDSVFGPFPGHVQAVVDGLAIGKTVIPFTAHPDISIMDLNGVDLVLECTGQANTDEIARRGMVAGAGAVLISGPSAAADVTVVLGANDAELGSAKVVSNASCTTNAIAPLLHAIDSDLGIKTAHITTIHCYTGSQPTVDAPGASLERSRAAAVSMVPTSTSAATQITHILPNMDGRLSVSAVRVPCISVSAVDAILQLKTAPSIAMNDYLQNLFKGSPYVGLTSDRCVSTDMRARADSLILALPETEVIGAHQVRLFGWYDNEWGFSARMLDMARRMIERI